MERVTSHYDQIGRKTGAPFLAVVFPPELENEVKREWEALAIPHLSNFDFRDINIISIVIEETEKFGVKNVTDLIKDPMPGSDAESELCNIWIYAITNQAKKVFLKPSDGKKIILVIYGLAALYPVAGPRDVMQVLWDQFSDIDSPIVILVPGSLSEARVYSFLNLKNEFMYRGDVVKEGLTVEYRRCL